MKTGWVGFVILDGNITRESCSKTLQGIIWSDINNFLSTKTFLSLSHFTTPPTHTLLLSKRLKDSLNYKYPYNVAK